MNMLLGTARWLLTIAISAALSLWIFATTVNATVANRDVVKRWLDTSGVYDKALGSVLRVSAGGQQDNSLITPDLLQEAFISTFDSAYIKQGSNTVIDASYNWLEGTANAITFSIPVHEKAVVFKQNLANLIQPKIEALPKCTTRVTIGDPNKINCLPPGTDPSVYAQQLTQPSNEANFLNEPLTEKAFSQVPPLPQLPGMVGLMHVLIWALPLAIVLLCGLYIAASPNKLRGISHCARGLTVGAAITLIGGAFLWYASTSIDLSQAIEAGDQQQMAIVTTLINPLARTVLPDVGMALTLYSSLVVAIAGATWLGVFIWRHKQGSIPHQPPHINDSAAQLPPANLQEARIPQSAPRSDQQDTKKRPIIGA